MAIFQYNLTRVKQFAANTNINHHKGRACPATRFSIKTMSSPVVYGSKVNPYAADKTCAKKLTFDYNNDNFTDQYERNRNVA